MFGVTVTPQNKAEDQRGEVVRASLQRRLPAHKLMRPFQSTSLMRDLARR